MTDDFFRARMEQKIYLKHPLAVLASRLPWAQIESVLAPAFARKTLDGKAIAGSDLLAPRSRSPVTVRVPPEARSCRSG
jgi:IS5 family transposase